MRKLGNYKEQKRKKYIYTQQDGERPGLRQYIRREKARGENTDGDN